MLIGLDARFRDPDVERAYNKWSMIYKGTEFDAIALVVSLLWQGTLGWFLLYDTRESWGFRHVILSLSILADALILILRWLRHQPYIEHRPRLVVFRRIAYGVVFWAAFCCPGPLVRGTAGRLGTSLAVSSGLILLLGMPCLLYSPPWPNQILGLANLLCMLPVTPQVCAQQLAKCSSGKVMVQSIFKFMQRLVTHLTGALRISSGMLFPDENEHHRMCVPVINTLLALCGTTLAHIVVNLLDRQHRRQFIHWTASVTVPETDAARRELIVQTGMDQLEGYTTSLPMKILHILFEVLLSILFWWLVFLLIFEW